MGSAYTKPSNITRPTPELSGGDVLRGSPPIAESCPETLEDVAVNWLLEPPNDPAPSPVLLIDGDVTISINGEVAAHVVDDRSAIIRECIEHGITFVTRTRLDESGAPVVRITRR